MLCPICLVLLEGMVYLIVHNIFNLVSWQHPCTSFCLVSSIYVDVKLLATATGKYIVLQNRFKARDT